MTFLNGLELLSKLPPDVSLAGGDEYMQSIQQLQDTLQNMMPYMMLSGGMGDMFSGIFDFGEDETIDKARTPVEKLTDDLQGGKITGEEFIKKLEEMSNDETDKRTEIKD